MEDLASRCKTLSLSDKEGKKLALAKNKNRVDFVLAAKFLTKRNGSIDAVAKTFWIDMTKRSGRIGFRSGQSGCGSNGSRVESGCESGRVDPYFSKFFFFFLSRCNLSIVYEFINYN